VWLVIGYIVLALVAVGLLVAGAAMLQVAIAR
jgi:hypothetical protein